MWWHTCFDYCLKVSRCSIRGGQGCLGNTVHLGPLETEQISKIQVWVYAWGPSSALAVTSRTCVCVCENGSEAQVNAEGKIKVYFWALDFLNHTSVVDILFDFCMQDRLCAPSPFISFTTPFASTAAVWSNLWVKGHVCWVLCEWGELTERGSGSEPGESRAPFFAFPNIAGKTKERNGLRQDVINTKISWRIFKDFRM